MTEGHVHDFGPIRFGRQLGPAHYEAERDPCACGLTEETFLREKFAELRRSTDFLEAALVAERVPEATVRRVVNRFLWGHPDGLVAQPMRCPEDWCAEYGLDIRDPDGWRTKDAPPWDQPITLVEFATRYQRCTVRGVSTDVQARFDADVKAARDA